MRGPAAEMRESRQFDAGSDRKLKFVEKIIVAPHVNRPLHPLFTENTVRFCNEDAFT